MSPPKLLTRDEFRRAVFARDGDRCVSCGRTDGPLDAHHIMERRLFRDGGYYLANGATLCDPTCHMKAESTELSVEDVRRMAGITTVVLPEHLYPDTTYDKWGNPILPNGMRLKGELLADESVRRVLAPVMDRFTPHVKAPRTFHLPWSPGKTKDDRVLTDLSGFEGREVVVTVKMDGENTSIYGKDGFIHARSVEPMSPHPSRDRVKALAAMVGSELPEGWRLTGENITAKHSIHYTHLAVRYTVFHGSAFGLNGHRNAEREALRWGKTRWPTLTSANVYCTASHQGSGGDAWDECRVTVPGTSVVWLVVCDDDDPNANDGCKVHRARIDSPKTEDNDNNEDTDAGTHPDATRSAPPR